MHRLFLLLIVGAVFFLALPIASALAAIACPPNYSDTTNAGICFPNASVTNLSSVAVSDLLATFLKWLLGIVGILGIIAFVISGIQYLTSAGDEDQAGAAKRNITYAIIGVAVALSGLIVITAIDTLLKGTVVF